MIYEQEIIEDIRSLNDIVSVVSSYVHIKPKGSYFFGICPFHHEKSPSFSVSADKQIYYCFGCGASGNVYTFIMQMEKLSFPECIEHLAKRVNYQLPEPKNSVEYKHKIELKNNIYELNKLAARFFYNNLNTDKGKFAKLYLDNRQINRKSRIKFGLGYACNEKNFLFNYLKSLGFNTDIIIKSGLVLSDNKGLFYDRFCNRIMFPIFNSEGRVVGFGGRITDDKKPKYLNSPDTPVFDKKCNLYGINFARKSKDIYFILVEGYIDVIILNQLGFNNVVASLGTALNIEHARLIKKYVQNVTLLFDSDEAGTNASLRSIPILLSAGLKVKVCQVTDAKDPDEFIIKFGVDKFKDLLLNSDTYMNFQVNCIKDKFNLKLPEDVIKFTKEVSAVISKVDNEIEKEVYIKDISKLTEISESAIKTEVNKFNNSTIKDINNIRKQNHEYLNKAGMTSKGLNEAKKNIIYLTATNFIVYKSIKNIILPQDLDDPVYTKLLRIIYNFYEKGKKIEIAEVLNFFDTVEQQKKAADVLNLNIDFESHILIEKTINELVKIIKLFGVEKQLLNQQDVNKIQELIKIKRNIQNQYISLADG